MLASCPILLNDATTFLVISMTWKNVERDLACYSRHFFAKERSLRSDHACKAAGRSERQKGRLVQFCSVQLAIRVANLLLIHDNQADFVVN